MHAPVNNTPLDILESMSVNDTAAGCPASALLPGGSNGCITFHAFGGHHVWPFFLELMAIPVTAAVEPAGWYSASDQAAGIPGWTYGPNASVPVTDAGDHPVSLPGGFENTTGAFYAWIAAHLAPTAWDMYEEVGSGAAVSGQYWGNVRYSMVGSGPYYMRDLVPGVSYLLQANPDYQQNPFCTWSGCAPAEGSYVGNVSVTWETSELPGEEAYAEGTAQFATIPPPSTSLTLQLQQEGKIDLVASQSLTVSAFAFDLDFDLAGEKNLTNYPVTVPSDFFSYTAARQLFIHSYDYGATESEIQTSSGIQYAQPEGGAIPRFLENYYPINISWPSSDANNNSSDLDSAAWWWTEGRDAASPYYDPELAACTASSPCELPASGQFVTSPAELSLWTTSVGRITGGAVKVDTFDSGCDVLMCSPAPGRNPLPLFDAAWSADYPDPSDFAEPFYAPNSTYTEGDAVYQQLIGNGPSAEEPFFALSCRPSGPPTVVTDNGTITSGNLSDLIYWANVARSGYGIATDCQGAAYREMIEAVPFAEALPSGPTRALAYDLIEQIEAGLGLYVWTGQAINVQSLATTIDPMDVPTNPALGTTWYTIAP